MQEVSFIRLAVLFEGGLLFLALPLGWLLGSPPLEQLRISLAAFAWGIVATAPPLLVVILTLRSGVRSVTELHRLIEERLVPMLRGKSLLELAAISALAGVGEEALFRGVLQTALASALTPWMGLLAASALFGLAHFVTKTYAVFAAMFGLYLGWLMIDHNNLLIPIVVHALYDFAMLMYLIRRQRR